MEKLTDMKIEKSVERGFDFEMIFNDGSKVGIRFEEGDTKSRAAGLLRYIASCLDIKNNQVSDGN